MSKIYLNLLQNNKNKKRNNKKLSNENSLSLKNIFNDLIVIYKNNLKNED